MPTDFDFVISDEAHRSIGGNARAVFEYFVGYKLGLTATPKDYLKKFTENPNDPRETERRLLLDTYRTFGCDSGQPTFRYSLIDGVKDGFLINPIVVDARTDITTQLLSDEGYAVLMPTENDDEAEQSFYQRDFEKRFFSEFTNKVFCKTFLEHALRDPISGEIGKSIIFAVSQKHARKLTQILNEMAHQMFPGRYQSDFAMQVTSEIPNAQQCATQFSDESNRLGGRSQVVEHYQTCKTRVCVTVGMMTTGYDCKDLLNIGLLRPIFSPTDFIQIKGRGTRTFNFVERLLDAHLKDQIAQGEKTAFKLFDFFANCEYFEEKYQYDQVLQLPVMPSGEPSPDDWGDTPPNPLYSIESHAPDRILTIKEEQIGLNGMKVDRMFFEKFGETARENVEVKRYVDNGDWERAAEYVQREIFNKPEEFFTLEKLRRAMNADRRVSLRELLQYFFGLIPAIKNREELLDEEFEKFVADRKPAADQILPLKYFFKAYITDHAVRDIIEKKRFADLNVNSTFTIQDFKAVAPEWRPLVPEYVKDYVSLNQFM